MLKLKLSKETASIVKQFEDENPEMLKPNLENTAGYFCNGTPRSNAECQCSLCAIIKRFLGLSSDIQIATLTKILDALPTCEILFIHRKIQTHTLGCTSSVCSSTCTSTQESARTEIDYELYTSLTGMQLKLLHSIFLRIFLVLHKGVQDEVTNTLYKWQDISHQNSNWF